MVLPIFAATLAIAEFFNEEHTPSPGEIAEAKRQAQLEVDELEQQIHLATRGIEASSRTDKKLLVRAGFSAFLYLYNKKSLQYVGRRAAAWAAFWILAIEELGIRGAVAAVAAGSDGPIPIMDLVAAGIAIWTLIDLIRMWDDLWEEATGESYYGATEQLPRYHEGNKATKSEAAYVDSTTTQDEPRCGSCLFFHPHEYVMAPPKGRWAGGCAKVQGTIHSGGTCRLWHRGVGLWP